MNWSMECYTDTRRQTVLVSNGEWKTESCPKKIEPLSYSSQNHLYFLLEWICLWNFATFSQNWSMEHSNYRLMVNGKTGIMSKTLTTCHILARIIFSFSAGMNLPQNVLQSSPIGQQNAKIYTPYLTVLVFNCEWKTESRQKHWLLITF